MSNVKYQHADYDEALAAPARRWRRRRGHGAAVHARRREGRTQRSVSVRLGEEIQALPRQVLTRARSLHAPDAESLLPVAGVALGAAAGKIKKWDRNDVLLVVCDPGTVAAGVFTRNRFCAAPVTVCREHLATDSRRSARSSSTPATPTPAPASGTRRRARRMRRGRAAPRLRARGGARRIRPASSWSRCRSTASSARCLPRGGAARADGWFAAANAIMTTDTVPKGASRRVDVDGVPVTVTGIAKGAGMIHPDMATMLSFMATDAPIAAPLLRDIAREVADVSFNGATVDGDTSTNDSFVLAATGRAAMPPITSAARSAPRADARRHRGVRRSSSRRRSSATARARPSSSRSASRAARRRRMQASGVRHRAFAAREDRVLRIRSQSRPHRVRHRQHGGADADPCARVVLARRRARRRPRRPSRRVSRGGRPARDEAGRDHHPRGPRPRQVGGDRLDVRLLARLRVDQRRLPKSDARSLPPCRARRGRARARRVAAAGRRHPTPTGSASPRPAGASDRAAAFCRRSHIRMRSSSTISSRSTTQKRVDRPEHAPVRGGLAREQRAADRIARHRQVVAREGDAREVRRARACA